MALTHLPNSPPPRIVIDVEEERESNEGSESKEGGESKEEEEAEEEEKVDKRVHAFVCRHQCCKYVRNGSFVAWKRLEVVVHVNGVVKHDYSRDRNKHEETAPYHSCMCEGTLGLCAAIQDAYIHNAQRAAKVRERFQRKLEDGRQGHQQLYGPQVRGENGQLKVGMKAKLIRQFGMHTLQDFDLTVAELEQKKRLHGIMSQNPRVSWQHAQHACLPMWSPFLLRAPAPPPTLLTSTQVVSSAATVTVATTASAPAPAAAATATPSGMGARLSDRAWSPWATPTNDVQSTTATCDWQQLHPIEACERVTTVGAQAQLEGAGMFIPFVHMESVCTLLANSPSGAVVVTPPLHEQPPLCHPALGMQHEHRYVTSPVMHYQTTLTVMGEEGNSTVMDRSSILQSSLTFQCRPEAEFYALAKAAMLHQAPPVVSTYAKDVELTVLVRAPVTPDTVKDEGFSERQRLGLWGALWGAAVEGSAVQLGIDAAMSSLSPGLQLFARIARTQKPHPLNPHLFNVHPRSLVHLLLHDVEHESTKRITIDWVNVMDVHRPVIVKAQPIRPSQAEVQKRDAQAAAVHNIQFHGFCSPMVYVKHGGNFFKGHLEQLAASSYNRCDRGGQYWIVVPFSEQVKMLPLFEHLLRCNLPLLGKEPLSADERALLPTLLLSRQLFIPPDMLDEHGIQYYRYYQKAGDVMVVQGYSFHQGVVDHAYNHALAEAVNYLDCHWLSATDGGLRIVYEVCRWLRTQYTRIYLSDDSQVRKPVRTLMFVKYSEGIRHFLAQEWSLHFFNRLLVDIRLWCDGGANKRSQSCIDYEEDSVLTKEDGRVATRRLEYCIETLELPEVKMLCMNSRKATERMSTAQRPTPYKAAAAAYEEDVWNLSIFSHASSPTAAAVTTSPSPSPSPSPHRIPFPTQHASDELTTSNHAIWSGSASPEYLRTTTIEAGVEEERNAAGTGTELRSGRKRRMADELQREEDELEDERKEAPVDRFAAQSHSTAAASARLPTIRRSSRHSR